MKFDPKNEEFREKLDSYIKWIDNPPKTDMDNYENKRRDFHKEIFDIFKVKRHSEEGKKIELFINKCIISMSTNLGNRKIAMINACQTQEELDDVNRKFEFMARYGQ